MKAAKVSYWHNPRANGNPKAPALNGYVELPASLVWELQQMLQAGQGMEANQQTGEPFFKLRVSVWNRDGANNGPVLSGEITSPSEYAAYKAAHPPAAATAPAPGAPGAPAWGGAPAAPAPGAPGAPGAPAWAPPAAPAPAAAPAAPPAAAPGWGGWGSAPPAAF